MKIYWKLGRTSPNNFAYRMTSYRFSLFLYFGNRGSEGFFLFAYTKTQPLPLIANPLQQHTFYITT
jgi:hypothetical protein